MFSESTLETSWAEHTRRSWTTLTSFALQAVLTAILLLIPLIRPIALPFLKPLAMPVLLAPPPGHPPRVQSHVIEHPAESNLAHGVLIMPRTIPTHIRDIQEESGPPQVMSGQYVFGSTGAGSPEGILHSLGNSSAVPVPPLPAVAHTPRVSHMMEGNLIRRVQPEYPRLPAARASKDRSCWLPSSAKRGRLRTCGHWRDIRCWFRPHLRRPVNGATAPTSSTTSRSKWRRRLRSISRSPGISVRGGGRSAGWNVIEI